MSDVDDVLKLALGIKCIKGSLSWIGPGDCLLGCCVGVVL